MHRASRNRSDRMRARTRISANLLPVARVALRNKVLTRKNFFVKFRDFFLFLARNAKNEGNKGNRATRCRLARLQAKNERYPF